MFNRHHRFVKWLHLYGAGELSSRQHRKLEAHLEHCDACRSQLAALEQLQQAVGQMRDEVPSVTDQTMAVQRVLATIDASDARAGWIERFTAAPLQLAAALVLVLILGTALVEEGRDQMRMGGLIRHQARSQVLVIRKKNIPPALLTVVREMTGWPRRESRQSAPRLSIAQRARVRSAWARTQHSAMLR